MYPILLQSILLEKVSMEVGFENCGEVVSPSILRLLLDSRKVSILISRMDFFTVGCFEKEVCEAWYWKNGESNMF